MVDRNKGSQQGSKPQPEGQKSNDQKPSDGLQKESGSGTPMVLTPTNQLPTNVKEAVVEAKQTVEQLMDKADRTPEENAQLVKMLTEKLANQMAANPMPDAKRIAEEAIARVHAARAKETAERIANPAPATGTTPGGKVDRWPDRAKKSTISNPVKFVWDLAQEMVKADPTARRKDIIEAAINAGVAGYTARTQYQAWYTAQRETARQQAKKEVEAQQKAMQQQTGSGR